MSEEQMNIFDFIKPEPQQVPMAEYLKIMGYKNDYTERPDHECLVEVVDIHEYPKLHFYKAKYIMSFGNIVQEYPKKCGYECHWWKEIEPITEKDQAKAPIWHLSLNHHWVECPTCKSYNTALRDELVGYGRDRHLESFKEPRCPACGQLFDWSEAAVEAATKYSKDYLKAMQEGQ